MARMAAFVLVFVILCVGCKRAGEARQGSKQSDESERFADGGVKREITVATSSESGGLDPAGNIALTYLAYSVTALDELLTYDENGEIVYRAAVGYEVNDDCTEWTFHLRGDARWSDGSAVCAADFVNTMTRALKPESGSGYVNYLFPIQNAEAIYRGEAEIESLGVETPDPYTLVFHLERPCVYFLDLLRLPVYTPSCTKYAVAADGRWDKDPETNVSNGPFFLAEYVPEEYFVLEKNPYYWNADAVKLNRITFRFFDSQEAMAVAYESGTVDVACGASSIMAKVHEGKEDLLIADTIATRYIYPNLNVKPLDDVRVRKALSLAVNREDLCEMAGAEAEPTDHFIAKYMVNKSTGAYYVEEMSDVLFVGNMEGTDSSPGGNAEAADSSFEEDLGEARRLLAEAGYPGGKGFPKLVYKYPSLELDSDVAQILQEQWKQNLGIEVELNAQELQVNYSERKAGKFDLCRMNWAADFADPYTYLSMLLSNSPYNCSGICDARYDALVRQSDVEMDARKRAELLEEAEMLAVEETCYVIPLFSVKTVNLVRPGIGGITQVPATGALELRYARWE
jgi:oligopeptide transport system substrate-binding protein